MKLWPFACARTHTHTERGRKSEREAYIKADRKPPKKIFWLRIRVEDLNEKDRLDCDLPNSVHVRLRIIHSRTMPASKVAILTGVPN